MEDDVHILKIRKYQFLYRKVLMPFGDEFRVMVIYKDDGATVCSSMEDFEKYAKDKAYSYDKQWEKHKNNRHLGVKKNGKI